MTDAAPSPVRVEKMHDTNYRVWRGNAILCHVSGNWEGWRVHPHSASRKPSRKAWPSAREAFLTYWKRVDWAKDAGESLPA